MINLDAYRIAGRSKIKLSEHDSADTGGLDKNDAERAFAKRLERLIELQELLYAQGKHSLLVVLQAMDAAGKDSTIRRVFGPLNPQGCRVISFKAPTSTELAHDFLWRIHQAAPARGYISVFNRSHYEDVLIVRVNKLVKHQQWQGRYEHINAFEKMLHHEGMTIIKFFLHISKTYQKQRLRRRLDRPDKHWKFNPDDLKERRRWGAYMQAYDDMLERCAAEHAPWYIVPAENRWFRNLLVAEVLVRTLQSLKMRLPKPDFDPKQIVIPRLFETPQQRNRMKRCHVASDKIPRSAVVIPSRKRAFYCQYHPDDLAL